MGEAPDFTDLAREIVDHRILDSDLIEDIVAALQDAYALGAEAMREQAARIALPGSRAAIRGIIIPKASA